MEAEAEEEEGEGEGERVLEKEGGQRGRASTMGGASGRSGAGKDRGSGDMALSDPGRSGAGGWGWSSWRFGSYPDKCDTRRSTRDTVRVAAGGRACVLMKMSCENDVANVLSE